LEIRYFVINPRSDEKINKDKNAVPKKFLIKVLPCLYSERSEEFLFFFSCQKIKRGDPSALQYQDDKKKIGLQKFWKTLIKMKASYRLLKVNKQLLTCDVCSFTFFIILKTLVRYRQSFKQHIFSKYSFLFITTPSYNFI
jgi:hypothetical protein